MSDRSIRKMVRPLSVYYFNLPPRIRQSAFVLLFGLTLLSIAWLHLVVTSIKRKEASGAYDAVAA